MINNKTIIFVFVLLITLISTQYWSEVEVFNFPITVAIQITLILFLIYYYYFLKNKNKSMAIIKIYLLWIFICLIRSFFVANNYWEWKNLVTSSLALSIVLFVYIFTNSNTTQYVLKKWFKFFVPFFFLVYFFVSDHAYGLYFSPFLLLVLIFPILPSRWKSYTLIIIFFVIIFSVSIRSSVVKYSLALIFSIIFYRARIFYSVKSLNFVKNLFLILPIIFLTLGSLGFFNIFKLDSYITQDFISRFETTERIEKAGRLTADTRTDLYNEVILSSIQNKYILFGRTFARGNDSSLYGDYLAKELRTKKRERFKNEVSILNIFTWTGLVGVILYFLIFYKASYVAINKSNNFYIKIIGIYVSFRWAYAWVEDFTNVDISNVILWLMIAMCFSTEFRNMTNTEIKKWVHGIFR